MGIIGESYLKQRLKIWKVNLNVMHRDSKIY